MPKTIPVVAIFDIGKTNKKIFLFDEHYEVVYEQSKELPETLDEDGYPCEDIHVLTQWMYDSLAALEVLDVFMVKAFNISAYGASFVYLNEDCEVAAPLYSYLKPYPDELMEKFYTTYGGKEKISIETASPVLGNLNSGMQLYFMKYQKPGVFHKIKYALHLPQYLAYLVTKHACSDITSIGCHTQLWNYTQNSYHDWVISEELNLKLGPISSSSSTLPIKLKESEILAGTGLHDSSAALIPYLASFINAFILISTGTWCISMNPFNHSQLTIDELQRDCLLYMSYKGTPVKASRLFAGYEHEQQIKRLALYYNVVEDLHKKISYSPLTIEKLQIMKPFVGSFSERDLSAYSGYAEAYHALMMDIVERQIVSTKLIIGRVYVKHIFVDGGFSKNDIYMNLLAVAFPDIEVFASSVAQATALGAALAIHSHWNKKPIPSNSVKLKHYSARQRVKLG